MALIERLGEQLPLPDAPNRVNPYALELDSFEVLEATRHLVATEKPLIDKTTNPEIDDGINSFAVYFIDGAHPSAVASRAIEGRVFQEKWEYTPEETEEEATQYESNSAFFLVVDTTDSEKPRPAVSLRVADCLRGSSATVEYFKEINHDGGEMPPELRVSLEDVEHQLWDIVSVMAPNEYRNGSVSVWVYHALYKKSLELGIGRWISSIVDKEFANLSAIGIPFKPVTGIPEAQLCLSRANKKLRFGFYSAQVDDIHDAVNNQISVLEDAAGEETIYKTIARIARLALNGTSKPISADHLAA